MKTGIEQLGQLKLRTVLAIMEVGRKKEAAVLELFFLAQIGQYWLT